MRTNFKYKKEALQKIKDRKKFLEMFVIKNKLYMEAHRLGVPFFDAHYIIHKEYVTYDLVHQIHGLALMKFRKKLKSKESFLHGFIRLLIQVPLFLCKK